MADRELRVRILSSIIFVSLVCTAIFLGGNSAYLLFLLLLILCASEFYRIILQTETTTPANILYIVLTLLPYSMFWYYHTWYAPIFELFQSPLVKGLTIFSVSGSLVWWYSTVVMKKRFTSLFSVLITGLIYLALPFTFAIFLAHFPNGYQPKMIMGVFVLVWLNDSGAYLFGKNLGRRPLAPKISPNKTIEGFAGGMFTTFLMALAIPLVFDLLELWHWLVMALIISITSPMGDILESQLKRNHQLKDSGQFLPGHGGALDRFDGFVFCLPFLQLFLLYFYP
ncbi:MAG TPA: phosphatidate cytidylyltransferase [Saprospiraceae bacterium]|nr:phosphatidate cytidylyltransferase [Saprospiraceae bacterium]